MNLILFEPAEIAAPLSRRDPRAAHILDVLRRRVGDTFDAGLVNGPRGKATLTSLDTNALTFTFIWGPPPLPLDPITLIIGLPRPQTARDVLREATALGVAALHFVATEKSEPSYARSTLWASGEWCRYLVDGAQQAFDTRLPEVTHGRTLAETVAALPHPDPGRAAARPTVRLALDHYEAPASLSQSNLMGYFQVALAIGPERGWSPQDRETLRANGFTLVHLGPRVLRTETACIAALAVIRSKLGLM